MSGFDILEQCIDIKEAIAYVKAKAEAAGIPLFFL
jgi:hypothetical protein